jgi:hypothetical protein
MGGRGGDGTTGAHGGDGGSASLNNAATASSLNAILLNQGAFGGAGGNSTGAASGNGGDGGHASSSITRIDHQTMFMMRGLSAATGGNGGNSDGATGGNGGNATASIALQSTFAGADVEASAQARAGSGGIGATLAGASGTGSASASATVRGGGVATADASVTGAANGFASAASRSNFSDSGTPNVSAGAFAPVASPAQAITKSTIGTDLGSATIAAGVAKSYVTGLPASVTMTPDVATAFSLGTVYAAGSMAIGYGGDGASLTYETSARFTFDYGLNKAFLLGLTTNDSIGIGFRSASLDIFLNGTTQIGDFNFNTLTEAQDFFNDRVLHLGNWGGGLAEIAIVYSLTSDTALALSGFRFDYAFGTEQVPVPAALPLFGTGLGLLGFMGWLRKRRTAGAVAAHA